MNLCRENEKNCRDRNFPFQFESKVYYVATQRKYVATNLPATKMRFDLKSVVTERNNVATEFDNNVATEFHNNVVKEGKRVTTLN